MCAALGKRIAFGSIDLCYQNHESGGGKSPPLFFSSRLVGWHHREGAVGARIVLAGGMAGPRAWITRHSERGPRRPAPIPVDNSSSVQQSELVLETPLTSETPRIDGDFVVHQRCSVLIIGPGRDHCSPGASFCLMSLPSRGNVQVASDNA